MSIPPVLALRLFGGVGAVFLAFFKIERGVGQNALFFLLRQLAHDLGRGAEDHRAVRRVHLARDKSARADDAVVADDSAVEHRRAHADDHAVADGRAVDGGAVADGHIVADGDLVVDQGEVLNVAALADAHALHLAAANTVVPECRAFTRDDVAEHLRALHDENFVIGGKAVKIHRHGFSPL